MLPPRQRLGWRAGPGVSLSTGTPGLGKVPFAFQSSRRHDIPPHGKSSRDRHGPGRVDRSCERRFGGRWLSSSSSRGRAAPSRSGTRSWTPRLHSSLPNSPGPSSSRAAISGRRLNHRPSRIRPIPADPPLAPERPEGNADGSPAGSPFASIGPRPRSWPGRTSHPVRLGRKPPSARPLASTTRSA
jgi:hypothetical protein